jgi:hypothetical protein
MTDQSQNSGQSEARVRVNGATLGAGNFDSGGQRGYVSVPGHRPIGYGF